MKTIGMLGGMSWESTVPYYRIVNEVVRERLGGLHSAKVLLHSVDFEEIEACQAQGRWDDSAQILARAAQGLEAAGADFLVICTNTMHKVAEQIEAGLHIPLLHIADATVQALREQGIARVALLGTQYTMEQDFYKQRIAAAGIEVLVPPAQERAIVHRVIYEELCRGEVRQASRQAYLRIIDGLAARGAQGVILGCTEIGGLIRQQDTALPVFDTTRIHAQQAALYALA